MDHSDIQKSFKSALKQAKTGNLPLADLLAFAETLQNSENKDEALNIYDTWIQNTNDPNKTLVRFNHASLLQSLGRNEEAEKIYRQCLAERPFFAQPCINLGLILERRGERIQAIEVWSQILTPQCEEGVLTPEMQTTAWNHIGRVREDLKQYQLAEAALVKSLEINPAQPGVIQHWIHIRQKACEWPLYQSLPGISQHQMLMATSPLAMLAHSQDPVQQLLTAHAFVGRTYGFKEENLCKGRKYMHDRTRIGYVSGDLCVHAVGLLLAELLEGHDRQKFEIYAYDFSIEDGTPHRQRLRQAIDTIRYVHTLTDRQIAEVILHDEIDVLIDLHGLSAGAKPGIFALHPAPLQGTYLGFIGTTGMPWFDFVITDSKAFPPELEPYFAEKPLRLNGSFIPLTPDLDAPLTITREQFGFCQSDFVMVAFGNSYKFNSEMFSLWLELLDEIPRSVLWLVDDNPATTANLQAFIYQMKARIDRVVFTPRANYEEYKQRLRLADVFLDTFPYNCGSTTNNVVQAGLPMVSMYGKTMVSRMGLSILSSMGLQAYCVDNSQDYKKKVMEIAAIDVETQNVLKQQIRQASTHSQNISQGVENLISTLIKERGLS